ncbi:MAG: hypothetical protein JXN59_04600 [Anaerolineae bacterium]|nr:hypothetical protein [Anaerolineae bacterium]
MTAEKLRAFGRMLRQRREPKVPLPWRNVMQRPRFRAALLLAVGLAIFWYLIAARVGANSGAFIWADQRQIFTRLDEHLADPYQLHGYVNVPWAAAIITPVALLPFEWSVLAQMVLYFVLLTLLIYRFGGKWWTVLLVLTSALAYDTALEINLDWIVVIGLLLPPVASGPFLIVKPQVALGAWFGFRWREMLWGGVIVLVVIGLALVLWPLWPERMLESIRISTLGETGGRVNIAPSRLLPWPVTWGIGLALAWLAFRRRDIVLGVLAWQFFVPYTTFYGIMPAFALLAVRWPWAALAVSLAAWVPYSQVLLPFLF